MWEMYHVRGHMVCRGCNRVFKMYTLEDLIPKRRPKRTDGQRAARRQEKKLTKDRKGVRKTWGSGSDPRHPSDGTEEGYRFECKTTTDKSRAISLAELRKIEREAVTRGQVPVLQLEFEEASKRELYVVLRWTDFQALTGEL